jgi:septum site-determining protein MinC
MRTPDVDDGPREEKRASGNTLLIDAPIRSGQTVTYPQGDVIIVGAIGSGAEVVAGGSIHVYGALRGRAIAGTTGSANARIFCRKLDPELLAIDGLYLTADGMNPLLRGKAAQIWLSGETMMMAALD